MIHFHPLLSVVTVAIIHSESINYVPLFSIFFQSQPSLSIIIHHYPSLSSTIHHYPSLSTSIHHYPSLYIHHHPSVMNHYCPSLSVVTIVTIAMIGSESINDLPLFSIMFHSQPSFSITIHHYIYPLSTIIHHYPSVMIHFHLSLFISCHNHYS